MALEPDYRPDRIYPVKLVDIQPSEHPPQKRRRERFKNEDIEELSRSFTKHGQLQEILLRPGPSGSVQPFQIVFGERRFLAAQKCKWTHINAKIRDLSMAETISLQWEENHRRMNSHPLDDAYTFKYMLETENLEIEQVADKFGTSEQNVTEKLRLNDLINEARTDLENDELPLRHAYLLGTFPEALQKEIYEMGYLWHFGDPQNGFLLYKDFKFEVEQNILRRLSNAPFDTENPDLHIKGQKCSDCVDNTGYAPRLFADITSDASCLNRSCFKQKSELHLEFERDRIAEKLPNPERKPLPVIAKEVPLVTDRKYIAEEKVFKEKVRTGQKFLDQKECDFSEISLIVEGARKGQKTWTCNTPACEVHNPEKEILETKARQLQNKFDRKVSEALQKRIGEKSLEYFTGVKSFWEYADLCSRLAWELFRLLPFEAEEFVFSQIRN